MTITMEQQQFEQLKQEVRKLIYEINGEVSTFVNENNYKELKEFIMGSNRDTREYVNMHLYSLVAQNDDLLNFLFEISKIKELYEFRYDTISLLANVFASSCKTAEDVKWMIKKMKEYETKPYEVVREAIHMFGCGEIERMTPLLVEMLSEKY